MKKLITLFVSLMFFSFLLSGCAPNSRVMGQAAITNLETRVIDAPQDRVFNAALEALFDLGYTIKHSDKESGILLGERQDARKNDKAAMAFFFGITGALAVTPIVYNCTILVKPIDKKTTDVRIKTAIDGEPKLNKKAIDQVWLYIDRQVLMGSPPEAISTSKQEIHKQPEVKHSANQADQLQSFLFSYCKAYESKDLDKFAAFFTPNATENNKDFHELVSKYRKNMKMIKSFNYRINIVSYSSATNTGSIIVEGKYFIQYLLNEGSWKENSGNISMELIENRDSYLIKRLNYASQTEKQVEKQPHWGPWIKVKDE